MNIRGIVLSTIVLLLLGLAVFAGALGPLDPPPGPIGPSMKPLSQISPTVSIESLQPGFSARYAITSPGSYVATSMITRGSFSTVIAIAASNVTVDFAGFGIDQVAPGAFVCIAIDQSAPRANITIKNGTARGPSITFLSGVGGSSTMNGLSLFDLSISSTNGTGGVCHLQNCKGPSARNVAFSSLSSGLFFDQSGLISNCAGSNIAAVSVGMPLLGADVVVDSSIDQVVTNAQLTVIAGNTVRGCSVSNIASTASTSLSGIGGATLSDCAVSNLSCVGTVGGLGGNTITNCSAVSITSSGSIANGCGGIIVRGCQVLNITSAASQTPLSAAISGTTIIDSQASGVSGSGSAVTAGISAITVRGCRVSGVTNSGAGVGVGITSSAPGSLIADCMVDTTKNDGISAGFPGIVRGCTLANCGNGPGVVNGAGVLIASLGVQVDSCFIANSDVGIRSTANSQTSTVIRNHLTNCTTPFSLGANVRIGPIVSGPGGTIPNTSPWANFID